MALLLNLVLCSYIPLTVNHAHRQQAGSNVSYHKKLGHPCGAPAIKKACLGGFNYSIIVTSSYAHHAATYTHVINGMRHLPPGGHIIMLLRTFGINYYIVVQTVRSSARYLIIDNSSSNFTLKMHRNSLTMYLAIVHDYNYPKQWNTNLFCRTGKYPVVSPYIMEARDPTSSEARRC